MLQPKASRQQQQHQLLYLLKPFRHHRCTVGWAPRNILVRVTGSDVFKPYSPLLLFRCAVRQAKAATPSSASICRLGHRPPVHRSRGRCASRGAWRRRARWTRTIWCARFGACLTTTAATTNSASAFCCCARTRVTRPAPATPLSSGRWRCASCRGCRSTASDSSVSRERRSGSRTSRRKSQTNCTCELTLPPPPWSQRGWSPACVALSLGVAILFQKTWWDNVIIIIIIITRSRFRARLQPASVLQPVIYSFSV